MHDNCVPADASQLGARYFVGVTIAVISYGIALVGCLAFFKIPLALTVGMMSGGLFIAMLLPRILDRRLALKNTSRAYSLVSIVGVLVISSIMGVCANSNWMTWHVHPAGFQGIWFVFVTSFFHFREILYQSRLQNRKIELVLSDYDENQLQNPYATPMQSGPKTNNPTDRSGGAAAS